MMLYRQKGISSLGPQLQIPDQRAFPLYSYLQEAEFPTF